MNQKQRLQREARKDQEAQFHSQKPSQKKLDLEEAFFILTREGVSGFMKPLENSLRRIIREEVEEVTNQIVSGIQRGLEYQPEPEEETSENSKSNLVSFKARRLKVKPDRKADPVTESQKEPVKKEKRKYSREDTWSTEEDTQLIQIMKEQFENKQTTKKALENAAEIIGRSKSSVKNRWYNNAKTLMEKELNPDV